MASNSTAEKRKPDTAAGPEAKRFKNFVLNEGTVKRQRKRILVAGGAGFIGSHMCEKLLEDECNTVICLDNCYSGTKDNVAHLLDPSHPHSARFEFVRGDVCDASCATFHVDEIYAMACAASPVMYQASPLGTLDACFVGTKNMLELARRCKARLLLTSTSEVYGDPEVHPQKEDYWGHVNPIGPRSCYDEGKRIAETLCMEYHRVHGVEVRIARIFNTYGPRLAKNDGRVVSNFIVQALEGKPLTVYGDGLQSRSPIYISDQVRGLMSLMAGEHMGPINIGNDGEVTILELASTIQRLVNPDVKIVHKDLPTDDPKRRRPDLTRARTLLGFEPTTSLEDGLKATVEYFRQDLAREKKLAAQQKKE